PVIRPGHVVPHAVLQRLVPGGPRPVSSSEFELQVGVILVDAQPDVVLAPKQGLVRLAVRRFEPGLDREGVQIPIWRGHVVVHAVPSRIEPSGSVIDTSARAPGTGLSSVSCTLTRVPTWYAWPTAWYAGSTLRTKIGAAGPASMYR